MLQQCTITGADISLYTCQFVGTKFDEDHEPCDVSEIIPS